MLKRKGRFLGGPHHDVHARVLIIRVKIGEKTIEYPHRNCIIRKCEKKNGKRLT